MSLERKDVRFKLDPEELDALKAICEHDGLEIGEWCERLVLAEMHRRIREAIVLAERTAKLGISGSIREELGISGRGWESRGAMGTHRSERGTK